MTLPDERTRAVLWTRAFLIRLLDPKKSPRVPLNIRREASCLLRHYPIPSDFRDTHEAFDFETAKKYSDL